MTTGHWDAQAWDKAWKKQNQGPRSTPTNRKKILVVIAAVSLAFTGAAVAGSQTIWDDPEYVGVCHATGSDSQPYVFLVVEEDGYEHGHHRHHDGDFFRDPEVGHCGDDEFAVGGPNGTDGNETGAGNDTVDSGDGTADEGNETSGPHNGTEDGGNETAEEDTSGNETGAPDNGTEDSGNETADEDASGNDTAPLPGDAAVRQSATQDDFEVLLSLVVSSLGEGNASRVNLSDQLPDVRRPWALGGADASQCVLDGLALTCWFGDLEPGETREVQLRAYVDRLPCGQSVTNTAYVASVDDAEARNDASSASVHARAC